MVDCGAGNIIRLSEKKEKNNILHFKFAIIQSEAPSAVLLFCDIRSLIRYELRYHAHLAEVRHGIKITKRTFFGTLRRNIRFVWSTTSATIATIGRTNSPNMKPKRSKQIQLGIKTMQPRFRTPNTVLARSSRSVILCSKYLLVIASYRDFEKKKYTLLVRPGLVMESYRGCLRYRRIPGRFFFCLYELEKVEILLENCRVEM